ncbi:MAG: hypothetical protein QM731_23360 [Chitinophagaceae bacterium]
MKLLLPLYTRRKRLLAIPIMLLAFIAILSCQRELHFDAVPEQPYNVILNFKAVVDYDTNALEFGKPYTNYFNESYTVKTFKFYIHGVEFINTDSGRVYQANKNDYFLVNCADSASSQVKVAVLPFKYNRIAFTIGVDSARNVSGAQTGALDPTQGMFWTWSTGYIMAKLEGTSPSSTAAGQMFEYHIGGFKQGESALRKVTLLMPFSEIMDLKGGKTAQIDIVADVNAWFYNPHDVKISVNPTCMTPGTLATQIAENYSKMFTITEVKDE